MLIERKILAPKVLHGKATELAVDIIKYQMKVGERHAYNILGYLLREGFLIARPRTYFQTSPKAKPPPWTQT